MSTIKETAWMLVAGQEFPGRTFESSAEVYYCLAQALVGNNVQLSFEVDTSHEYLGMIPEHVLGAAVHAARDCVAMHLSTEAFKEDARSGSSDRLGQLAFLHRELMYPEQNE